MNFKKEPLKKFQFVTHSLRTTTLGPSPGGSSIFESSSGLSRFSTKWAKSKTWWVIMKLSICSLFGTTVPLFRQISLVPHWIQMSCFCPTFLSKVDGQTRSRNWSDFNFDMHLYIPSQLHHSDVSVMCELIYNPITLLLSSSWLWLARFFWTNTKFQKQPKKFQ